MKNQATWIGAVVLGVAAAFFVAKWPFRPGAGTDTGGPRPIRDVEPPPPFTSSPPPVMEPPHADLPVTRGLLPVPPPFVPPSFVAPDLTVPIQDGATIDFSIGAPVVRSGGSDSDALERSLREMDEATKNMILVPIPGGTEVAPAFD